MKRTVPILLALFSLARTTSFGQDPDLAALLVKANEEIFHQRNAGYIDQVFADTYHIEGVEGQGPQLIHGFTQLMFAAFPDLQVRVDILFENGQWVAWRRYHRATHEGAFMGFAPTGKTLEWESTLLSQYDRGKVVFETGNDNLLEKLRAAQDPVAEGERLMQLSREWSDLIPSGDIDAIMAGWAEDAVMMPPDSPPLRGKAAIRAYIEYFNAMPGAHIGWEPREAHVSESGDMAYLIERNEVQFQNVQGEMVRQKNKVITVWRKNAAGKWENVIDMWNAVPENE